MRNIRKATSSDLSRIAEIEIFNYRLNFYPIFRDDDFYFNQLQVPHLAEQYKNMTDNIWVYDDGAVKGFIMTDSREIKKLFVEPVLQGLSIGSMLLSFAVRECKSDSLWALEKNTGAIRFYARHGFYPTSEKRLEDGTTEYLVRLEKRTDA